MNMKHHESCACEKCDTGKILMTEASAVRSRNKQKFRPYPVSRVPVYENPAVMMSSCEAQPGVIKPPPTPTSVNEAFLSAKPSEAFRLLLKQQPKLVNERGFNGQVPLHKAALRGDQELVELLIQNGADVNARTDYLETPLLFACKRGNPRVMHMLIDAGADIEAVDKSGKGTMHHAAQGGSVLALHYLSVICNQDFNRRDYFFILPIHLTCLHGHTQAFQYLTRHGRSEAVARDGQENTCLHLAAQGGHDYICWLILEKTGTSLLNAQNNQGITPSQAAAMGNNMKHREVATMLTYYQKQGSVRGPIYAWWFHLLLGPVYFPMLLFCAQLFPHKGSIMLVGLLVLIAILYRHIHRLRHVCRWPNPVQAGVFAAGFFHSMICSYVEILPYVYTEWPVLMCIAAVQTVVMLYMYYNLLTRDPGVISESEMKEGLNEYYNIRDIATGCIKQESLCQDCELVPPPRSHHCKLCQRCYYDLDHHCLFLYHCIARYNHRLFVLFLIVVHISMLEFILMSGVYILNLYPGPLEQYSEIIDVILWAFRTCPWVGSLFILNFGSLGWGAALVRYQINLISRGHTTAYQPSRGITDLTFKERCHNVLKFFQGRRLREMGPRVITS